MTLLGGDKTVCDVFSNFTMMLRSRQYSEMFNMLEDQLPNAVEEFRHQLHDRLMILNANCDKKEYSLLKLKDLEGYAKGVDNIFKLLITLYENVKELEGNATALIYPSAECSKVLKKTILRELTQGFTDLKEKLRSQIQADTNLSMLPHSPTFHRKPGIEEDLRLNLHPNHSQLLTAPLNATLNFKNLLCFIGTLADTKMQTTSTTGFFAFVCDGDSTEEVCIYTDKGGVLQNQREEFFAVKQFDLI